MLGVNRARACLVGQAEFQTLEGTVLTGSTVSVGAAVAGVPSQKGTAEEERDRARARARCPPWAAPGGGPEPAPARAEGRAGQVELRGEGRAAGARGRGRGANPIGSIRSPRAIRRVSAHLPQWPDRGYLAHFLQDHIFNQDKCKPDGLPPTPPCLDAFPVNPQGSVRARV